MHAPDPIADDPVLAELAVLVREARPEPDPRTANALDRRVAVALRNPDSVRRRRPVWLMPSLAACASILLVVAVVISATNGGSRSSNGGASGLSGTSGGGGAGAGAAQRAPEAASSDSGSSSGGATSGASGSASSGAAAPAPSVVAPTGPGRAVERSATMTIATARKRLDDAASGAARVATNLGGYVASSNVSDGQGADLDLRVPSGRVDQAVGRLSQLGHVRSLQRGTLDITDAVTNAVRRVQEDRAERRSLLRRLAAARTSRQEDRIRARLTAATQRLDADRRSVAELRRRAGYATIAVTIVPEHRHGGAAGHAWTPKDALHDAARVLEVAAGVALVALAILLPVGLLGAAAWAAARRFARRRREHALDFA
jgi:hypothetical protein